MNRKAPNSPSLGQPARPSDEPRPSTSRNDPFEEPSTSSQLANIEPVSKGEEMDKFDFGRLDGSKPKWPGSTPRKKLSFPIKNLNKNDVGKIRHEAFKNNPFSVSTPDSHPKSILKNPTKNLKSPKKGILSTSSKSKSPHTKEKSNPSTSNGGSYVIDKDPLKKPKYKPITFDEEKGDLDYKSKKTAKHTPITFSNDEEYGSHQKPTDKPRRKPSRFDAIDPHYVQHKQQSYDFDLSKDDSSDYYYKQDYSSGQRRGSWSGYHSTTPAYAPSYSKPVIPNSSQIRHVNPQSRPAFQGNHR